MSFDALGELNWLAVIVGALAYFVLGAIWYAPPVLGKPWMRASGIDPAAQGQSPSPAVYVGPLAGNLVAAIATGMLALSTGSNTVSEGIVLGLVIGIGYAVTLLGIGAIFETTKPEPLTWFLINASYHVVGLVIVALIVSSWE
jgi:Protein of unknown function (DUF1761)